MNKNKGERIDKQAEKRLERLRRASVRFINVVGKSNYPRHVIWIRDMDTGNKPRDFFVTDHYDRVRKEFCKAYWAARSFIETIEQKGFFDRHCLSSWKRTLEGHLRGLGQND